MNEVRNIIVGFELGEKTSQICYFDRSAGEPISLYVKTGSSQYTFPGCLSKKKGEEVYHYGIEAEYFASQKGEQLIGNLYAICKEGKDVEIEGEMVSPARLLSVFLGEALGMLGVSNPSKNISAIMVTVPDINKALVDHLQGAFAMLNFPAERCFLQNYDESFYYYTLSQKPEFWNRGVGLFTIDEGEARFKSLRINRQTRPASVFVKKGPRKPLSPEGDARDLDFSQLIEEAFGNDMYSGIFLVGDGFDRQWAVHSVPLLCRNKRHVFYGNNLYCKGACYAAREKVEGRTIREVEYQGEEMVSVGIGMELLVSGIQRYYPLVEQGIHWYEAKKEFEILLEDARELVFLAGSVKAGTLKRYAMKLPDLPERPKRATRLEICLAFESAVSCRIRVRDMGLGDLFPSSGLTWEETLLCS